MSNLNMKKFVIVFGAVLLVCGCTQMKQIQHLDELLTLKEYSDEKDGQEKFVNESVKNYERLAQMIDDGTIEQIKTGKEIMKIFGRPIASKTIVREGLTFYQWLYRHPILSKAGNERVYLYLTPENRLVHWEHLHNPD